MTAKSIASLVAALRQHRLLDAAQVDELSKNLSQFSEPKALLIHLFQRGWLTKYQATQILQGRGKNLLLGSYVLMELVGEGGMGQVFKARNWKLGRVVALKLIRKEKLENPDAVRRFHQEVQAAAALSHPNIVMAFDADLIGETHLLVMEYIEGASDLARLVKENGPLPVPQACEYIRQAALGLQHAADRGLVHRDIKPHNLLVAGNGSTIKVLDMGLARLTQPAPGDQPATLLTQEGAVMGTPDYIAPEQAISSHNVDIRADIYSLGCTFYHLLAGQPPFPGGTMVEKLLKHQLDEAPSVETMRPEVSAGVAGIIRKMMAKKAEERFQTPGEVVEALTAAVAAGAVSTTVNREARKTVSVVDLAVSENTVEAAFDYMARRGERSAPRIEPSKPRIEPSKPWLPALATHRPPLWIWLLGGATMVFLGLVMGLVVTLILRMML